MIHAYNDAPDRYARLCQAHRMAMELLQAAERSALFRPGVSELQLSRELQALGQEMFGSFKHWHKRIVRAGANTLSTYGDDPPETCLQTQDIMFVDLGPVFEAWEADIGRTYVIGDDPQRKRMRNAVEAAWHAGQDFFRNNRDSVTGADMYEYAA